MKLDIAADLSLPTDVITQTFAILAIRRVGKTYTASVLAEEMMKADLPFVVLDPTGAWWGLRASADGKRTGYPVIIIGGEHGDVPLEPTAGKVLADLVVDHPGWYVIDLSQTNSNAEQDRIACDFAEQLYRRKAKNTFPLHLFVDEADSFAPQQALPNQKRMLGAFEALVRRGGIRGIGTTLITQRPAVLNKNVLTQADNLIVLRITAPQDRTAIDDWVKGNGTKEQRDVMMNGLASLEQGEGWVWSPGTLGIFQKVRIRQRETFNSSATPKPGEHRVEPQKLAPVDLDKLRDKIAETIEKAKADDPKALRAEIAALKKQLKEKESAPAQIDQAEIERAVVETEQRLERAYAQAEREYQNRIGELNERLDRMRALLDIPSWTPPTAEISAERSNVERPPKWTRAHKAPATEQKRPASAHTNSHQPLAKGERAVLTVIAQYPDGATREQITILTGYKRSSRDAYIQRLRVAGMVEQDGDTLIPLDAGIAALGPDFEPLPTGEDLQFYWLERLPEGERRILEIVLDAYPKSVDRETISEATDYKRSSRDAYLQRLNARKLTVNIGRGEVRASDVFFE